MNIADSSGHVDFELARIAVRGHIVPRASELRRRQENRGKRRNRHTEGANAKQERQDLQGQNTPDILDAPDMPDTLDTSEWLLTEDEEREAVRIIGPRPWYTLAYDSETVVADASCARCDHDNAVLRNGQPLRVGYYELRGMPSWEVAKRLRRGKLKPDDRHRLHEAGFVLPDPDERIALADGSGVPAYKGFEATLAHDRRAVEAYIATHAYRGEYRQIHIHVRGKQDFIKNVLYTYVYGSGRHIIGARLVGHQLFFDLTRLVTDVWTIDGTLIRGTRRGAKWARRGFSFKLCDCRHEFCFTHPRIRVCKLGRFKMRYAFQKVRIPTSHGQPTLRTYRGKFLDTIPFGLALRKCTRASLEAMGETFHARERKRLRPGFAGPIDDEFLVYLVGDVRATYWLAVAELEDYSALDLPLQPESVYSTASLAKAMLRRFGFPPASERRWHLEVSELSYTADDVAGIAASTYFGGRAEVRYRGKSAEVIHLDFKSQYGAVSHRMGLQSFWLAADVTAHDCTDWLLAWLASRTPDELRIELGQSETWRRLTVLVHILLDGSLTLPVRADYAGLAGTKTSVLNIGQSHLRSSTPVWYTLADVLAGMIRDGVKPSILQAIQFVPSEEQAETHALTIAGTTIDPSADIVWTRILDIRREIKRAAAQAKADGELDEAQRLSAQEHALKEMALAGSYGILEELNEKTYPGRALTLDVYALGRTKRLGNTIEESGPYFAGALGTFIPAGGRLLLAIAERLCADRGLSYAFMDTDSITPYRPDGMSREAFRRRVHEVVDFFTPLNPYADGGSLLSYEDQNFALDKSDPNTIDKSTLDPLYCIATSAKRYVEYNLRADGTPVLRKFTSHGLGTWGRRQEEELPNDVPPPHTFIIKNGERIPDSSALGGPMWVYELQYHFVRAMLTGHIGVHANEKPLYIAPDGHPRYFPEFDERLDAPAFYQFSIETWDDYMRMRHIAGLRPGGFITLYPAMPLPGNITAHDMNLSAEKPANPDDATIDVSKDTESVFTRDSTALYSPYVTTDAEAHAAFARGDVRRVADDRVDTDCEAAKNMYAVVANYFIHPEVKAANPQGVGELARRHIEVSGVDIIGKESNRLAQAAAEDTNSILGGVEQFGGRSYGDAETSNGEITAPRENPQVPSGISLSSLFDEDKADILAASCLSLPTVNAVLTSATYEASPQTQGALALAMQLLDPEHPQSIAGWRDEMSIETLAHLLDISPQDAHNRFQGRATWTEEERARLVCFMAARQMRTQEQPDEADEESHGVPPTPSAQRLPDARLLIGVPFHLHTIEWRPSDISYSIVLTISLPSHRHPMRLRVDDIRLLQDLYALDEGQRETAVYVITRDHGDYRLQETTS